ncbi:hypothetical protein AB4P93_22525 [Pseudomonas sp. B26140]|uniref:hypothetical protein n=1 Tax=Pseudomonas sp. B26140 TaxID=3235112 RepID=UPI003783371A
MPMIDSKDFKEALAAFVQAKQNFRSHIGDAEPMKDLVANREFEKLDQILADKQALLQEIQNQGLELANRVERLVELQSIADDLPEFP